MYPNRPENIPGVARDTVTKTRDEMTKSPDYNINLYGECVYFSVSFKYLQVEISI